MSTLATTNLKHPSSGSNNVVLASDGTTTIAAPSNIIKSGTSVASTSGTSIDFTGIPSWVKRITVMLDGVSLSGSSHCLLQIGTASGVENASYISDSIYAGATNQAGQTNSTSGFVIFAGASNSTLYGTLQFFNISGNTWVSSHVFGMTQGGNYFSIQGGGDKTLSGTLNRVRITTVNGTDTFDAGTINILYEG